MNARDDFGFPDDDNAIEEDGITSDMCAAFGCIVIYYTTRCSSAAEAMQVGPFKQSAVDAGALPLLEELLQA